MHRVVINSGGLDSAVTLALALAGADRVETVYVNTGSRQSKREAPLVRGRANQLGIKHHTVKLECSWLSHHLLFDPDVFFASAKLPEYAHADAGMRAFVVPMRNLMFLSVAVSFAVTAGADELWAGFDYRGADKAAVSPSWDKRPEFVVAFENVVAECNEWNKVRIVTPLQGHTKSDTIALGKRLKVDFSRTWSCYNCLPLSCGVCPACVERKAGFAAAGVKDPLKYASKTMIREYVDMEV